MLQRRWKNGPRKLRAGVPHRLRSDIRFIPPDPRSCFTETPVQRETDTDRQRTKKVFQICKTMSNSVAPQVTNSMEALLPAVWKELLQFTHCLWNQTETK